MRKNRTRLLWLFLLSITLLIIIIIKNQLPSVLPKKSSRPFANIKPEEISQIIITSTSKSQTLNRKNGNWFLKKDKTEYQADQQRVNQLIASIINLNQEVLVSTNKNRHQQLGIGKQKITFYVNQKSYQIYIGNNSGINRTYLRIDNQPQVFLGENFADVFTPDDYRDLNLHLINDENKLTQISLTTAGTSLELNKKNNNWFIDKEPIKKDRIDFFINDLKNLKATDILPNNNVTTGLADLTINLTENGKKITSQFYPQPDEKYLVTTSASSFVFEVSNVYVSSLKKSREDFLGSDNSNSN